MSGIEQTESKQLSNVLFNNLHCQLFSEDCVATIASDEEREMEMQGSILRSHPSNWSSSTRSPLLDYPLSTLDSVQNKYPLTSYTYSRINRGQIHNPN